MDAEQSKPVTIGSPTEPEPSAETEPQGERGEAQKRSPERTEAQRSFGALTPQEAGRKGAQARRDRAIQQETEAVAASDGRVVLVRTPVQVGTIIARLGADAAKGNTQAARELRAYLSEFPREDATDLAALDARTRQEVLARTLLAIEQDEGEHEPAAPLSS